MKTILLFLFLALTTPISTFANDPATPNYIDKSCYDASFTIEIIHRGLLGTYENILNIRLLKQVLDITFQNAFRQSWQIDITKPPTIIKHLQSARAFTEEKCPVINSKKQKRRAPKFCKEREKLKSILVRHGLSFVGGQKHDMETDQGKMTCVYNLVQKYLDHSCVFSRKYKLFFCKDKKGGGFSPEKNNINPFIHNIITQAEEEEKALSQKKEKRRKRKKVVIAPSQEAPFTTP